MLVIKNHMINQSSCLLEDYLMRAFNATLILNSEKEVIFSNKMADELFGLAGEESRKTFFDQAMFEIVQ